MALKVRLDPQAKRDLLEIRSYLTHHAGAVAAEHVRAHIRQRINRLSTTPLIGVATGTAPVAGGSPVRDAEHVWLEA